MGVEKQRARQHLPNAAAGRRTWQCIKQWNGEVRCFVRIPLCARGSGLAGALPRVFLTNLRHTCARRIDLRSVAHQGFTITSETTDAGFGWNKTRACVRAAAPKHAGGCVLRLVSATVEATGPCSDGDCVLLGQLKVLWRICLEQQHVRLAYAAL